ncbi:hypothetical protein [Micromonospora pallida]|uniref:hypothetical protein n=1 Tax=Micromonospora pallida TaxID=145854 RepID=UPI000B87A74D|nr:hypothetical protein [Micromonospora pallida]
MWGKDCGGDHAGRPAATGGRSEPGNAEEYDVRQRQLRGNLPQGFVHALMLETAVTLGQVGPCH